MGSSGGAVGRMRSRARLADIAGWIASGGIPVLLAVVLHRLWETSLRIPLSYAVGGDALRTGADIKTVITTGWYFQAPALGAPGTSHLYEVPMADAANFLLLRFIGLIATDWGATITVFYLLTYALAGASSYYVLRRLGVARGWATGLSILFAWLPYHWMRGVSHLMLSQYAVVPLLTMLAVETLLGRPPLLARAGDGSWRWDLRSPRSVGALAIAVVAGATGVYYAFFGAFLMLVAAVWRALRDRDRRVVFAVSALVAVAALVTVVQVIPNVAYNLREGPNPGGLFRDPGMAEILGVKITQLLLPISGHRLAAFAKLKQVYVEGLGRIGHSMVNEGLFSSLGLLGSFGFVASVMVFVFGSGRRTRRVASTVGARRDGEVSDSDPEAGGLVAAAGLLNVAAVLLATVGGLGAVLAVVLTPIRAYTRISVFIAFLSFVSVAALVQWVTRARGGRVWRWAWLCAMPVVVGLALLDQTPASMSTRAMPHSWPPSIASCRMARPCSSCHTCPIRSPGAPSAAWRTTSPCGGTCKTTAR
jgi:phosphoglycerol transferase